MPFIPALNTAKVVVVQDLHNEVVTNTFHVRKATAWSTPELTTLANTFITWWNDDLANNLSQNMILTRVAARDMTVEDGLAVEVQAPLLSGGQLLSPAMPGNVALAVKHISGFAGRNRRGRSFVAGMPENGQEGNEITVALTDSIVSAFEVLRGAMVAADQELVVASFYDGTVLELQSNGETIKVPVARATALLSPILSFSADTFIDSQRRRLAGRGN
jgi:hypothetical protein